MKKRKKKRFGSVQGHALLYGRSSRAIRIFDGEIKEEVVKPKHFSVSKTSSKNFVQKKYKMDENTEKRIDNLKDPLTMISRQSRAEKYEVASKTEKYEYGLSDW